MWTGTCLLCLFHAQPVSPMLSEEHVDQLRSVFAEHPAVRAAYLFGSEATDRSQSNSDVDLAVVVDEGRWDSSDKIQLITECMDAAERDRVDIVVLNGAPLVLQFEAVRPNRPLYGAADFDHGDFFSRILRMYWDFVPYLRHQRKAYKRRLLTEDTDGESERAAPSPGETG